MKKYNNIKYFGAVAPLGGLRRTLGRAMSLRSAVKEGNHL